MSSSTGNVANMVEIPGGKSLRNEWYVFLEEHSSPQSVLGCLCSLQNSPVRLYLLDYVLEAHSE